MLNFTREIIIIFVLILANGIFAMSEIALVSARKIRLEQLSQAGDSRARAALKLANNPNQILSTVQIGISLVGIFAGAFGGATIAEKLAVVFQRVPLFAAHSEGVALAIVVLTITYLSLVIGELVPKRLALSNPEKIATQVAKPLRNLATLVSPVVHLLSFSTDLILHLFGTDLATTQPLVTEEEIKVMLKQGTEAGMFEVAEHDMIERVLQLDDRKLSTLMTPRPEIIWLSLEDSAEVNRQKIISSNHTRFLVCQASLDDVLGIVQVTDLLSACLNGKPFELTASLRQPLFVPESTQALKVLELFKQTGTHIALIVDEYGVIQGIVTLNDVMEAIVGDIPKTDQSEAPQAIQREDGSWLLDGVLAIAEFRKLFGISELPGEQRGNYHTLGGFVITHLGKIPSAADHFEWRGLRFEVMDMDGNRVDKILVMPSEKVFRDRTNDVY
ncbi:MAG: hemolysin family protein [Oscillatoria sp. PMC 1068.18]|nr:hemolysin family protein [Oscillatoria sp. PMC 1076.18]MEC4988045.1 hemolysin family protein [Oscillatoria sp. PMC 1068.18]